MKKRNAFAPGIVAAAVAVAAVLLSGPSWAYDQYSTGRTTGNCATCHGGFRSSGYVSKVDGQTWTQSLHDTHRDTMLNGDCSVCHYSSRFPTYLGRSQGGTDLPAYGCAGCHGRSQDGTGTATEGYGAGLRQGHFRAGQTGCVDCHADANPASKTVVGEKTLPPYYGQAIASHPAMPSDPCNPAVVYNENYEGTTLGIDNDGDGQFDASDTNCQTAATTPGETSSSTLAPMRVTAYDKATGNITVGYGAACGATDNHVEYGPLAGVSTYQYTGQVCALGNGGSATFNVPTGSYFLIVGNNGTAEGSYGLRNDRGTRTERPEDTVNVTCPIPQDLGQRCD